MVRVSQWAVTKAVLGIRSIASAAKEDINQSVVHIRVYPRPRNLAESRGILRVLEKYGEVVVYKHLKVGLSRARRNFHSIYNITSG